MKNPFIEHLRNCNKLERKKRAPLFLNKEYSGWVDKKTALALTRKNLSYGKISINIPSAQTLTQLGRELHETGYYQSLHELFDVSPTGLPPVFGHIDRGAIPLFGFIAKGVHLNGLVEKNGQLYLWVGHRSPTKKLDPSKLDHISAGGVPAGYTPHQAIIKEATEEAGIDKELTKKAQEKGRITYALDRKEGLRRDILFCYDLYLPEDFRPQTVDGEVESFELVSLKEIYRLVCETNVFKFNVNLAHIDLLLRHNYIDPDSEVGKKLRIGLNNGLSPLSPGRSLQEGLRYVTGDISL